MPDTLPCPYCQAELSDADIDSGVCPACGKTVEASTRTVDLGYKAEDGQADFDPEARTVTHPADGSPSLEKLEEIWGDTIQSNDTIGGTLKTERHVMNTPSGLSVAPMRIVETGTNTTPPPHYELIEILGQGGMGVIYTARQASLGRTIAMKMIKGDAAANEHSKSHFLSEAAVTGDLAHPNIVPVYDLGANEQGELFYAMKKVEGTPWDEVVHDKPLNENLDILMSVADAVAFAHSKGVIHRDLKPENVMLGEFGEVLVMDWGLAASVTSDSRAESLASSGTGGTPAYMAPEMAGGDLSLVGFHSDVYLLGGILYEIVTGLRPHTGDSVMNCIYNITQNIIQKSAMEGELVDIAMTAMATAPEERYASVKDFQQAIRNYEAHFESIALCNKAREDLKLARKKGDYEIFAQAVFGFKQAWELWGENANAQKGMRNAQLAYAECALEKGDLDLAASQLDVKTKKHRKLADDVKKSQELRVARQKRLKTLTGVSIAAGILIVVGAVAAALWIGAAEKKTADALVEAQKSQKQTAEALAQVTAEQKKTSEQRDRARLAQKAEAEQRKKAEDTLTKLQEENYSNAIYAAQREIKEGRLGRAQAILTGLEGKTGRDLRGWEWGRLMYRCLGSHLVLKDHGSPSLYSVALSPDGLRLVTAGAGTGRKQFTTWIWDIRNGKKLRHMDTVDTNFSMDFSPDGKRLLTGNGVGVMRLWDTNTGKCIRNFQLAREEAVWCVRFSPDGMQACATSPAKSFNLVRKNPSVKIWSIKTGRLLRSIDVVCSKVEYSPDGKWLVIGGKTLAVFDPGTGDKLFRLGSEEIDIHGLVFFPDGTRLAVVDGSSVVVWHIPSRRKILTIAEACRRVAVSPDGMLIAAENKVSGKCTIWASDTGKVVLNTKFGISSGVAFLPDGHHVVTCDGTNSAVVWDMTRVQGHLKLPNAGGPMAFSPDGKYLAASKMGEPVAGVWDTRTGRKMLEFKGHSKRVAAVCYSPDGRQVITAGKDNTVRTYDATSGRQLLSVGASVTHMGFPEHRCAFFTPDGKYIAITTRIRNQGFFRFQLVDSHTGKRVKTTQQAQRFRGSRLDRQATMFSDKGDRLLTVSAVHDAETYKKLLCLDNLLWKQPRGWKRAEHWHIEGVNDSCFSPDSRLIATVSNDTTAKLWNANDGSYIRTLKGHTRHVLSAIFSPDSHRLITGGADETIIWDTRTGREMMSFPGKGWHKYVAISTTGDQLATGAPDAQCRIYPALDWTKSTKQLEAEKLEHWKDRWKKEQSKARPENN